MAVFNRHDWEPPTVTTSPYFRSWIFFIMHHFVPEYNEPFGIHVNTQTVFMFPYILDAYDVFHMWYVSYILYSCHAYDTTTAATVLQVILQECWCFLLLAAVVRLHRTGAHACSLCVVVYPLLLHVTFFYMWIWWGRFFYTYQYLVGYFAFFFFQSTKANKRNDSSSVAASGRYQRLLRHQACMQRNDQSRRTFVKVS